MKVFLTGATGYVGSAIAQALHEAGHSVAGLARTEQAAAKLKQAGIDALPGDLRTLESLQRAATVCDAVIHAAMSWTPDASIVDESAVRAMLHALEGSGKTFLYTSGVWVMGDTKGRVVGEMYPLRPPPFVAWRPAVEKMTIAADERGVKAAVIRPPMVYGRGGGTVGGFVKQARENGVVRYVGNGENYWSFVHIDALAELYRLAVEQQPSGEVLLASDGPSYQVKVVAEAASWAGGAKGKIDSWPLEDARAKMGPMADCLVMDQRVMSTKAGRMLGWDVRRPSVLDELMRGSYCVQLS